MTTPTTHTTAHPFSERGNKQEKNHWERNTTAPRLKRRRGTANWATTHLKKLAWLTNSLAARMAPSLVIGHARWTKGGATSAQWAVMRQWKWADVAISPADPMVAFRRRVDSSSFVVKSLKRPSKFVREYLPHRAFLLRPRATHPADLRATMRAGSNPTVGLEKSKLALEFQLYPPSGWTVGDAGSVCWSWGCQWVWFQSPHILTVECVTGVIPVLAVCYKCDVKHRSAGIISCGRLWRSVASHWLKTSCSWFKFCVRVCTWGELFTKFPIWRCGCFANLVPFGTSLDGKSLLFDEIFLGWGSEIEYSPVVDKEIDAEIATGLFRN